jgi:tRNA nucleotidyltransferase (CCA-adding enzyme)
MSAPPITVSSDVSCKSASELLIRYNINALLVTQSVSGTEEKTTEGELLGFISRQIIEKALYHKLGHIPVQDYMTTEMFTVGLDSDLQDVQEKIIENKQRVLPVVENRKIMGVITRTDLLNILVQQTRHTAAGSPDPFTETVHARTRNITRFMMERVPAWLIDMLKTIGKVATELGYGAYVAGGSVRDLFLYRRNEDIDIVIEGDGIAFAKKYASIVGARIHAYQKFGTAVIIFPDGYKIDVASARLEYYQFPAALPIVEMSSIKLDLFRRDFTINTLAIQLNPKRFGTLIDFFSGQKALKEKVIRVLHNLSFVEDPTRVFRAIRFEQRFGFTIGKVTAGLIQNAIKMDFFKRLSGRRVFSELRQILEEENPVSAMLRLKNYDLIKVIHPALSLKSERVFLLNAVKKVLSWHDLLFLEESYLRWVVYFLVMIRQCDVDTSKDICDRLELTPQVCKMVLIERFDAERCLHGLERKRTPSNSDLYFELSPFKTELILYMMAVAGKEKIKRGISHYFTQLRYIKVSVKGKDLLKMGLKPGPIYRKILQRALKEKLNGKLKTRTDELDFARKQVRRYGNQNSDQTKKPA